MNTLVKIGLLVAVALIFPFMVGLGIEAFYPSPKDAYEVCADKYPDEEPLGYQDSNYGANYDQCFEDHQAQTTNPYNRNVFIVATVVGFIAIAVGTLYFSEAMGPASPGLVFGGLFTIIYGAGRGFEAVDKRWLFLELLIILIGLIIIIRRYIKITDKK